MGTGSRMLSSTAEARVEGRRRSRHPSHHQQGDGRVRVQVESVLGRFTLPSTTFHRHPHCTCVTQRAPNTGTSTYARKSWGGLPRCDLAPQSTSFGTVALRERQHLAMAATCPEGEAWAASRNWNHGTHFLWDPRAAPTFHPPSTLRHRTQWQHVPPSTSTLNPLQLGGIRHYVFTVAMKNSAATMVSCRLPCGYGAALGRRSCPILLRLLESLSAVGARLGLHCVRRRV